MVGGNQLSLPLQVTALDGQAQRQRFGNATQFGYIPELSQLKLGHKEATICLGHHQILSDHAGERFPHHWRAGIETLRQRDRCQPVTRWPGTCQDRVANSFKDGYIG
ncbi:hypothetical protein cym2001_41300 [Pseudomonas sp. CYM-20-01]|nr:hypothetical protein cym2001_41300 [Pseudomonas sp. CYM-20-01]